MDRFRIGSIAVHRIEEWQGSFAPPEMLFQGYEASRWDEHVPKFVPDYFRPQEGKLYAFLQSWVLNTGTQRILFDTWAGNDKDRPGIPLFGHLATDFLARMRRAGFAPEDIDIVVCSHIHVDHVGWNTRLVNGRWEPTFRNARYILPLADRDFWDPGWSGAGPGEIGRVVNAGMFEDSVQPLVDAGRVDWAEDGFEIALGLSLHAAPGHTPGSMMMRVISAGRRAMFVGDIVHHPMQIYQPGWNSAYCEDRDQSRETRRRVLTEAADSEALLIPAHFGGEHIVQVARDGPTFRPVYSGKAWA